MHWHKITYLGDVGMIATFLKAKIPTEIDMEEMDSHTPDLGTSTIWRVKMKLAGCSTFSNDVCVF